MTNRPDSDAGADDLFDEPEDDDAQEDYGDEPYASVVHVDRQEDVATVCGRIDTASSYAVVIHAPGGNRALSREIGMRRVIRHTEETGKTIAFATSNVALASRARSLGIPVARKPEHVRWDSGGRMVFRIAGYSLAVPAFGRLIQVLVIVGIAAVAFGLLLTMGPSATVIAYPPSESLEQTITIRASENSDEIDLENLRVPATEVQSSRWITVVVPTTGTAMVGTAHAALSITVTNTSAEEVTVPAGAIVLASTEDGTIEFALEEELVLAPGATGVVMSRARVAGERGNVPPESVTGFADPDFALISALNGSNGGGGQDEPRRAVDQEDIVRLRDTVALLETAESVKATIVADRPRDAIFVDTAHVEIERGEPSATPGTVVEIVSMEVRVSVTALAITEEVLDEVARAVLRPSEGQGEFIRGTITAVETGNRQVDVSAGIITTELRLRGEFARDLRSADIEDAVKGRSPEEARSILETSYGISHAEVDLWPGWAPRLPRFGFRIDVELRSPPDDDQSTQASTTTQHGSLLSATSPTPVSRSRLRSEARRGRP